jgi:uncharacterized protein involved in cysteine biosynthesis
MDIKHLAPFIALVAALTIIGIVLVNWFSYRLKKHLLDARAGDENILGLIRDLWRPGQEALKWGLVLLSGGLGLIVNGFIPVGDDHAIVSFGVEIVFLGAGFLSYYVLVQKKERDL